jgi:hypothetical protein
VQHGASTLPDDAFYHFPKTETAEIHLATGFQNMLYDLMPAALRAEIYEWLKVNAADERKAGDSDEQFFYKTRRRSGRSALWSPGRCEIADRPYHDAKFTFVREPRRKGNSRVSGGT